MKMQLLKTLAKYTSIFLCLSALANTSMAATKVWTGASGSSWSTPGNWTGGVPSSTDDVTIGVTAYSGSDPIVTSSATCNSITFGPNNGSSTTKPITLTVTGAAVVLTVTTTITQNFTAGTAGSSKSNIKYGTYTTTITGTGSLYCTGNFVIGSTTVNPASYAANIFIISSQISHLTINGDLLMNATGNGGSTYAQNYPAFNLDNNKLTLNGQFNFTTTNNPVSGTYAGTNSNYIGIAIFCANNNANITTLELTNNTPIKSFVANCCVDFDNKGSGNSITIYDSPSGSQRVYTDADYPYTGEVPDTYINLILSNNSTKVFDGDVANISGDLTITGGTIDWTTNDPNINVSGNVSNSTTITEGTGTVTIDGNWQNNSGSLITGNTTSATTTIGGTLTNNGTITCNAENFTVSGNYTNTTTAASATFTAGSGNIIFDGNYTNGAGSTFKAGPGTVYFSGSSAQTLQDNSTNGTVFNNVTFNGSSSSRSTVTMTAGVGNFGVSPSGILTITSPAKLVAGSATTPYLTLNSDATGSAIVAAISGSSTITGIVNVERFIKGSSTDLSKRGYRLISSAVYTGTSGGANVYDLSYLLNSVYVSGAGSTANGFNVTTTTNPSIYLFREDDTPPPSSSTLFYTNYNWKGVAKINNSPTYNIGIQARNTTANVADTTTTLPVGNGMLFYFRGNNVAGGNHTTAGTQLTAPFNFPDDVTLTQTGTLNTGNINVKLWYANAANNLGNNLSFTLATTAAVSGSTSQLTGGFALVGNPYPSTINWEKFNNTHASGAITGGGPTGKKLTSTIWVFNMVSKQYEAYTPLQGSDVTSERPGTGGNYTGSASNFIASGQGFFVKATAIGQSLSFSETAKISAQTSTATLPNLMGKPKEIVAAPQTSIRLKLMKDSINADDIAMSLNNNSSTKFVDGEDAEDLGGSGALVSLSAYTSDSVAVAINSLPFPGKQPEVVRLLVDATASGTYQLVSPVVSNVPQLYAIWLKDAFTSDSVQLKANTIYSFTIDKGNAATFGNGRFTLVICQNPAFAYQLISFTADKASNDKQVQTVWKTANEQNYTNFTVERSIDSAKTFAVVGGLQGTGAGNYSLLDKKPEKGQNLYRLKQQDINNTVTYSDLVEVLYADKKADKIHLYPNPATNVINLDLNAKTQGKDAFDVIVTNTSGTIVKQGSSADTTWQAGISNLRPGTYLVSVLNKKDKNLLGQAKFVKL